MYLCILDTQGESLLHSNFKAEPESFLKAVAPYRDDLVLGSSQYGPRVLGNEVLNVLCHTHKDVPLFCRKRSVAIGR